MIDWREFLSTWDREKNEILSLVPEERARLPGIVREREARLFSPAASAEQIALAEVRLGCIFPEELKSFYLLSNGLSFVGMDDMRLAPVENVIKITDVAADYWRDVAEYFSFENEHFISPTCRKQALLISNAAQLGFCAANPTDANHWEYACVEFGARSEKFHTFSDFLKSTKWYCLHYLRANLG